MMNEIQTFNIEHKIMLIRNQQVMIDRDLAELYGIETKRLNEQVKRNIERFPADFMFALQKFEKDELVANCDRFKRLKHSSTMPYAFTEQGVAMLSSVLKSPTAVAVNIQIMRAFVSMRHFLRNNAEIFAELKHLRQQQIETDIHLQQADKRIDELFSLMEKNVIDNTQGIFFQGQIFDAYAKFEQFIQAADKEIILIDNYVDLSVLQRLTAKKKSAKIVIYTDKKTQLTQQDIQKFNTQYPMLSVQYSDKMHDRFMIIDGKTLYHIGASLKDLGKKCFAFEILNAAFIPAILNNL